MPSNNLHGSAVVLGDRGVLILGPSGSGKSTLALALTGAVERMGRFGRLLADDQLLAAVSAGRLVCSAPATIAGLIEIRGLGPTPVPHEARAVIDLVVRLVPAGDAPRLAEDDHENVLGSAIPLLTLAEGSATGVPAVLARLGLAVGSGN